MNTSQRKGLKAGIEAVDANVAVINRNWDIVVTNNNWVQFGIANGHRPALNGSPDSENYLSVLKNAVLDGDDSALKAMVGISTVMNRDSDFFEMEYPCHIHGGKKRWFNMQVLPVEDLGLVLLRHRDSTQHRATVKALEGTENRLGHLFRHSREGILVMDSSGRILEANPRAAGILQYSPDELILENKKGIFDLLDADTVKLLPSVLSGEQVSAEMRMKQKTGESIDVELSSSKMHGDNGELLITVIFNEITRRKQFESDLASEKRFIDSAINSLPGIFYVLESGHRFVRWNRNFVRTLGYFDDELTGLNPLDLFPEDEKGYMAENIKTVFDHGAAGADAHMITREGDSVPFRLTGNRFTVYGRSYLIGTGIDLTGQKKLERSNTQLLELERKARKAAVKSRNELEKMIRNAPSPICLLEGPELRIELVNNAFKRILGRFKITGLTIADIAENIHGDISMDQILEVYKEGRAYLGREVELKIVNPDDHLSRTFFFNFVLQPVKDEHEKVYGIFIQAMDVTGMVKSRTELRKSLQEQQVLIEEVHHRVKNNLAIISGLFELQIDQETDDNTIEKLRDSQLRIYSMAAIHEMLYKNESLSEINFAEYIENMLATIFHTVNADDDHIRYETDLEPVGISVTQAIPLGMILNELVSNVLKHAFKEKKNGLIRVKLHENRGIVQMSVSDNGIGCNWADDHAQNNKLGVTLINLLASQLAAQLHVDDLGGTSVGLSFAKDFREMQVA